MNALLDGYDALIVDADGVIYRGAAAVPYAVEALTEAATQVPWCVLTNNAAAAPGVVADRISRLGLQATPDNVITSPQGAVEYLRECGFPPGSAVLVVGGSGIDAALDEAGFLPVHERSADIVAVVQGLGFDLGWRELSEAGYAIVDGAVWVATNLDPSIPLEHGLALGNGALVAAIAHAIGKGPDAVTGKPEPRLFHLAAKRMAASSPLVLGDRPDTDILGANRAGMDSLLVLTGVTGLADLADLVDGDPQLRPTYLARDLRALAAPADELRIAPDAPGDDALSEIRRLLGRAWADQSEVSDARGALDELARTAVDM